jgi:hypothetical protein
MEQKVSTPPLDIRCIQQCTARSVNVGELLQVQRNWMYLENIFIGSEDIRKQLPQESLMFEGVHNSYKRCMQRLHNTGNVVEATTAHGVLEAFQVSSLSCKCMGCHMKEAQSSITPHPPGYHCRAKHPVHLV